MTPGARKLLAEFMPVPAGCAADETGWPRQDTTRREAIVEEAQVGTPWRRSHAYGVLSRKDYARLCQEAGPS